MDRPIIRAEYEEFVRRMQDEHKRIHHRITGVEQTVYKIHDLAVSVEKLAVSVQQIANTQHEHAEQIDKIESRDGEMWRKAVGYSVTAIIGMIIGVAFT